MNILKQIEDCNQTYLKGVTTRKEIAAAVSKIDQAPYSNLVKYYAYTYLMGLRSHNHNAATKAREALLQARATGNVFTKQAQTDFQELQNSFMRLSQQDNEKFCQLLTLFAEYYAGTSLAIDANQAKERLNQSWLTNLADLGRSLLSYALAHPIQTGLLIFSAGITAAIARQPKSDNMSFSSDLQHTHLGLHEQKQVSYSKNYPFKNDQHEIREMIQALVTKGLKVDKYPAQLAMNPRGLTLYLQASNQGDALASLYIAKYLEAEIVTVLRFTASHCQDNINRQMAEFFYARALQQSGINNKQAYSGLIQVLRDRFSEIGAYLADIPDNYNPKILQEYESLHDEFILIYNQLYSLYRGDENKIAMLNDLKDELETPNELRKRGVALPPEFDPIKANLEIAMSKPNALEALTEEEVLLHTIPFEDDLKPQETEAISLYQKTQEWLSLTEQQPSPNYQETLSYAYFRQATQKNITAMLKLTLTLKDYLMSTSNEKLINELKDGWFSLAMQRGSVHAAHLRFQEIHHRSASTSSSQFIIQRWEFNFIRHIASLNYPSGSYHLSIFDTGSGLNDFFKNQTDFQRGLSHKNETQTYFIWLERSAQFFLILLARRGLLPYHALIVIVMELVGSHINYQWTSRLLILIYLAYCYHTGQQDLHLPTRLNQPRIRPPIAPTRKPAPMQITREDRTHEIHEEKRAFLNALLNEQINCGLVWILSRDATQFILKIEKTEAQFKLANMHAFIIPVDRFLPLLREVLATFVNGLNTADISIPCTTNQGEWPNIVDLKQLLHSKLIALHDTMVTEDLQQVQDNCKTALTTCEIDLSAQENLERERLWRRIAGYQEILMATVGNEEIKESVKLLCSRKAVIHKLLQEADKIQSRLKEAIPVTMDNIEQARSMSTFLVEHCREIRENIQRVATTFSALPNEDELTPSKKEITQKVIAVQPATKPVAKQRTKRVNTFFKNSQDAPKLPVKKQPLVTLQQTATIATVTVQDHSAHIWSLLSDENPYRDQKPLLYRGLYYHTLRMLCALSQDDTIPARMRIGKDLFEALSHAYFIALREPELLVEFCREMTDPKSYKILDGHCIKSSGLYQAFSHHTEFASSHYQLNPLERLEHVQIEFELLQDCRQVFRAEKLPKFATHYHSAAKGCLTLLGECTARLYEVSLSHRVILAWHTFANYKLNLAKQTHQDELKACCQILLDNIKLVAPFITSVNYYGALKLQLTKMSQALASNAIDAVIQSFGKIQQTLEKMTEANERLPNLIRTVHALDACRYRVRNKTKHKLDLVSLAMYARENLTVAIDEISDHTVLGLTDFTCVEIQMQLYADLIRTHFELTPDIAINLLK